MSSPATISNDKSSHSERRGRRREPLKRVVLVFFGENNWGKLLDVSESGISFEFAREPSPGQQLDFKVETMGSVTAHPGGGTLNHSFVVVAKVIWTRQFERTAGAQFLDLSEEGREQIRNLLSLEPPAAAVTPGAVGKNEALLAGRKHGEPSHPLTEILGEEKDEGPWPGEEDTESTLAAKEKFDSELLHEVFGAPTLSAYMQVMEEPRESERPPRAKSKSSAVRIGLVAGCVSVAVLTAVAVAPRIQGPWTHHTEAVPPAQNSPVDTGRAANPESRPTVTSELPFRVEVIDANNQTSLLWFAHDAAKSIPQPVAHTSATSSSTSKAAKKATPPERPSVAATREKPEESKLITPQMSRPRTNALAKPVVPNEAPVLSDVVAIPRMEFPAGFLTNREILAPNVRAIGGQTEPARLLEAVPPVYPPLARSSRATGEVTVDALIDASGNVTGVHAMSGPILLQQAAIDAVRQWKYEPARLDGQPVAIHLSVTVKFSTR